MTRSREDYERFYAQSMYTPGDVNQDSKINASDALLILQHSVQLVTLEGPAFRAADVNSDGKVDASDALRVLKHSVGLIEHF